ncbi:DUF1206 domain-containing protein [Corynebacterium halotolerans]|uniref:DUF1206 domain-containing protein n=1 Tax=Corynebacterium halotolerans YIM 70093 = DSM 44683 TaxID=1121362 RepID=M1NU18_9CORY|nr:DUF1206 domain-containing protein [Corynebacterium halotolerans]AGF72967.1 hypothetical protein A605_09825 [Corynebacterium halotolerans YIM 70093 = DSM 44683]
MDLHQAKNKAGRSADRTAQRAADQPALVFFARAGFIVLGVLHLIIGWIAVRIATGSGGGEASNSGALQTIAEAPGGRMLLWIAVVALVALGLWRLTQLVIGEEAKDKAKGAIMAVVYLSLAFTTSTFARGGSSSDGETASDITATVLAQPAGMVLVIIAGLVVLGVGLHNIYRGATKGFKKDLEAGAGAGHVGSAIIGAGMAGYIARGIAFAILGGLIVWGAWTNDPEKAGGLDVALRTLGAQPAGALALIAVGIGLGLYGLYSIARARYVRM